MSTKIYIAPYVRGPQVDAAIAPQSSWKTCWRTIGRSLTDLAPQRLIDKSGILFSIEVVLVATLVGTGFAWLSGIREHSLAVILGIDGLLAVFLLTGNLVRTAVATNAERAVANPPAVASRRAYRATNYRGLRSAGAQHSITAPSTQAKNYTAIAELVAGEQCAITTPSTATEISSHLDLEAIDPAELCEADVFLVEANQTIFADGTVLEGIAMVDESAITGQSAPVLRWAGGETAVMRDSRVIEGQLLIQVIARRGHPLDWIGGASSVRRPEALPSAPR